jgi:hypothetical protein
MFIVFIFNRDALNSTFLRFVVTFLVGIVFEAVKILFTFFLCNDHTILLRFMDIKESKDLTGKLIAIIKIIKMPLIKIVIVLLYYLLFTKLGVDM